MPLKAGTINPAEFAGSMAQAMEHAFLAEWPNIMHLPVPQSNDHMRLLFIAVAQGVVRHLYDHLDHFSLKIDEEHFQQAANRVRVEGTLY